MVVLGILAVRLLGEDETSPPPVVDTTTVPIVTVTATSVVGPTAPPEASDPQLTPTPAPTAPVVTLGDCLASCFVRVAAPDDARVAELMSFGLQPAYAGEGQVWGAADRALIDRLTADGTPPTLVRSNTDTADLYVVRFPGPVDLATATQVGEVLDQAGREVVVQAHVSPPPLSALANLGIAVEKVPPLRSAPVDRRNLPGLGDLTTLMNAVSDTEIEQTIRDLMNLGVTGGGALDSRQMTRMGNIVAAEYLFRRMDALGLTVRYDDFIDASGIYATNVVGELPGDDASRVFLVVAHYDTFALDGGASPGADDNASGVAAMLEIARVLAQYRLPHPVQFVAFTGEEVGFQGVTAFAQRAEGTPYAGGFNLDAVGSLVRGHQLVINGDGTTTGLQALLTDANNRFPIGEELLIRQNELIVSDDTVLRQYGIPVVLIARAVYGDNPVHHTSADVIENIDVHSVNHAATLPLLGLALLLTQ